MKYDLDPDFRPKFTRNQDGSLAPTCAKCMKRVNPNTARKAWVNWATHDVSLVRSEVVHPNYSETEISEEFIGPDCWKTIGLPSP